MISTERIDELGRDGLRLIQDSRFFSFGVDAVLLSDLISVPQNGVLVDFCSGNGIVPILASSKTKARKIYGMELFGEVCSLFDRSIRLNGLEEKVFAINDDIKNAKKYFKKGEVDAISVNPPYMPVGTGLVCKDELRSGARHELFCTLNDVFESAADILDEGKCLYMVHRPYRLNQLFALSGAHGFKAEYIRLVHPFIDKEASMVLMAFRRGKNPMLKVDRPLIIYNSDKSYTDDIISIYND